MDTSKRERLEKAGFRVGTVAEFLGMTPEESDMVEIRLALTHALRRQRKASGFSQAEVAAKIGVSQSRVAKMEAGAPRTSFDLLISALVMSSMTRGELADAIAGRPGY